jgi:tetratricopeptide (TPR) repeat protein
LKQNVLATTVSAVTLVILTFSMAVGETLDEVAERALAAGDTAAAITRIKGVIETDPTYHYNYYILGRIAYEREQYTQARDYFRIAYDKKKKHYESLYYYGLSELALENVVEAEKAFDTGLKKARDMKAHFEYGMGLVRMAQKDYQEADRAMRRAIAANDTAAAYHIALGDINFYQGIPALAVSEYETALALDTAGTDVYFHWAEACLEMKDYQCAMEKLRVVLARDSTFARAWNRAGGIYFKAARSTRSREERQQRYMDAIGSYERYIELSGAVPDSDHVRPFFEIALAYYNINRYEEAVEFFDKVLSIPYEPRDIYFYLGKSLWGIRQYERAGEVLLRHQQWVADQEKGSVSRVDEAELNKLLGDSYFYRSPKDYYNAAKYYRRSLDIDPNQDRLLQNVAVAYHNMRRYSEAIQFYDLRIAAGMDSSSASIYKNAALCALHLAGADTDEADLDEEMMDEGGDDGGAAAIDPNVNYYEVAIGYMNNYLEYSPNDTTIVERVANTYLYQLYDCANGVAACQRLLDLDPSNCQAKKSLGFAYFGGDICTKDLDKTLRYLTQAYDCMNDACADPALVKWIAQAYHLRAVAGTGDANSDYKNAFEWYGRVLKCTPSDEEAKKGQEDTRFEFN